MLTCKLLEYKSMDCISCCSNGGGSDISFACLTLFLLHPSLTTSLSLLCPYFSVLFSLTSPPHCLHPFCVLFSTKGQSKVCLFSGVWQIPFTLHLHPYHQHLFFLPTPIPSFALLWVNISFYLYYFTY